MTDQDLFDKSASSPEFPTGHAAEGLRPPLAARMRPETLEDVVGQEHILGPGKLLRRVIEADRLTNLIFYGPPGCGKTTLAEVISRITRRRFERTSGVLSNVATLRSLCETARLYRNDPGTILFIDEIHRFSKSQQDVLLPYVENGTVTLIGATTHNPNIFVNSPLTSRSLVFELRPLSEEAITCLVQRALADSSRGLGHLPAELTPEATQFLATMCDGDARRALNALEIAVRSTPPDPDGVIRITHAVIEDSVQRKMVVYDKDEDGHYDTISAFIKSVRGSDPHAAIYWLAKMLEAGEDPRFIARRLIILASEDIGNADPRGLTVAVAAMHAVEFIGMPEARISLAQATTYLATAPKSNASYLAVEEALADVRSGRVLAVPEHLKNVHVRAVGREGLDTAYKYPHDYAQHTVDQLYLPKDKRYYRPAAQGYEETLARRMEHVERLKRETRE
ncbi:MAG TPA: replication-associated recombination protein A [Kiritimatiellia bacterium]|jgi:putative ATPase|nr:replication-associated recombination protein A [Kiritimatiellia bacterium]HOM58585.1 replication-associated recombination protein A [Kiritimatiellia bacterium]HOR98774.1 replication-associated recombination protein A [Kiritimatiellia bacterium]HPW75946.1 replication-associated recombination protein A [Kiritimatiellia bacterium]HRU20319.1 replication-associated recombination protein A [Kiritimatiellia bacterium]